MINTPTVKIAPLPSTIHFSATTKNVSIAQPQKQRVLLSAQVALLGNLKTLARALVRMKIRFVLFVLQVTTPTIVIYKPVHYAPQVFMVVTNDRL
jgi:hypothetical protein